MSVAVFVHRHALAHDDDFVGAVAVVQEQGNDDVVYVPVFYDVQAVPVATVPEYLYTVLVAVVVCYHAYIFPCVATMTLLKTMTKAVVVASLLLHDDDET